MYYHKVSGTIPENKHREFEQTLSVLRSKIPVGCSGIEFSKDPEHQDNYFFVSYWEKLDPMEKFIQSFSSVMILGAFKTLGTLKENKRGLMIEIN